VERHLSVSGGSVRADAAARGAGGSGLWAVPELAASQRRDADVSADHRAALHAAGAGRAAGEAGSRRLHAVVLLSPEIARDGIGRSCLSVRRAVHHRRYHGRVRAVPGGDAEPACRIQAADGGVLPAPQRAAGIQGSGSLGRIVLVRERGRDTGSKLVMPIGAFWNTDPSVSALFVD